MRCLRPIPPPPVVVPGTEPELIKVARNQTYIDERVKEFGGVHKYDLTPDVTHLIVGDYDTAKYRHVARERPDIKPMAAGWINAVRSHWVNDQEFDFANLESEFRLRPFESGGGFPQSTDSPKRRRQQLLICLTGFEDHDRQYIEDTVVANGGTYMGDLSRRVTHLIVCKPEGKKYQAAKNWNITTVSIEWLDDSVRRGMILDEVCYDPILPKEDRGKGAIIRKETKRHSLGAKRPRDGADAVQQNGPRKLRKSASMRLNSQGNNLLNEIFNNSKQHVADAPRPALEQKSLSTSVLPPVAAHILKPLPQPLASLLPSLPSMTADPTQAADGVFASCRFMIHGFLERKHQIMYDCLTSHGGRIAKSVEELSLPSQHEPHDQRFLVVPQTSQPHTHPIIPEAVHIVTEFYIERCIHGRQLLHPTDHVLGRPFPSFPVDGFEELTIHSTGFRDEQLNQVEKTIIQLGAKYAERFNNQSSLMLCPSLKDVRTGKLDLALRNKIPVINAEWLWQCISAGFRVPWDSFVFPEIQHKVAIDVDPDLENRRQKLQRSKSEPIRKKESRPDIRAPAAKEALDLTAFSKEDVRAAVRHDSAADIPQPKVATVVVQEEDSAIDVSNYDTAPTHQAHDSLGNGPLCELGKNALNKSLDTPLSRPASHNTLRRFPTGATVGDSEFGDDPDAAPMHVIGAALEEEQPVALNVSHAKGAQKQKTEEVRAAERAAMAKQFTSLMDKLPTDDTNKDSSHTNSMSAAKTQRRKREILGRATSNASAASSASAESGSVANKPKMMDNTKSAPGSMGLLDEMLSGEQDECAQTEEAPLPPATQVGYDDPQAREHREKLMDRIQGKKKSNNDQVEKIQEKPANGPVAGVTSTAASRRTRRKGF
ncbi:hypothetical protein TruAng_003390 [Truncatella angustata]|nr:hypothetical protein TruAng_003390 [Truncatella angustata]